MKTNIIKHTITFLLVFGWAAGAYSQNTANNAPSASEPGAAPPGSGEEGANATNMELPSLVPPSPTVASLMKFEEVPVSHYTGIPDISIPFSSNKLASGKTMEIKLSYHPSSIAGRQVASNCGLGWNLIAGGTISRTVKGYPDELLKMDGRLPGQVGIYHNTLATTNSYHINQFYTFSALADNNELASYPDLVNEFLWDVNVRGKYDTEHDMYQYNFLGHTGRFIIEKQGSQLVVKKLDINPLVIINNYSPSNFSHSSFTIIDEEGNRYLFDRAEESVLNQFSSSTGGEFGSEPGQSTSFGYRSAWQMTKIFDGNGILQAEMLFGGELGEENQEIKSTTTYADLNNSVEYWRTRLAPYGVNSFRPLPTSVSSRSNIRTIAAPLSGIDITGSAKIRFVFAKGRSDSNLVNPASSFRLSSIAIQDWHGNVQKKYTFSYIYSGSLDSRMMLSRINEYGSGTEYLMRNLEYKPGNSAVSTYTGGVLDALSLGIYTVQEYYDQPIAGVLTKMTLPTGGHVEFGFGPSTYSYIGDTPITDFGENYDKWNFLSASAYFTQRRGNPKKFLFSITEPQYVRLSSNNYNSGSGVTGWNFNIYKMGDNGVIEDNQIHTLGNFDGNQGSENESEMFYFPAGAYYVDFYSHNLAGPGQTANVNAGIMAFYRKQKLNSNGTFYEPKYKYGKDAKIGSIKYVDANGTQKIQAFNYNFFDQAGRSSGSLAYPEPVFKSVRDQRFCVSGSGSLPPSLADFTISYDAYSTSDLLSFVKTKGYGVGYKNVESFLLEGDEYYTATSEVKKMVFTSPIDYPEVIDPYLNTGFPFLPTLNIDYKRGLLLKETLYDRYEELVKEIKYAYSFVEDTAKTGIRVYNPNNKAFVNFRNHQSYSTYRTYIQTCTNCFCFSNLPSSFISHAPLREAFGWAKLDSVVTRDYDYHMFVESKIQYDYKDFNQRVGTKTATQPNGDTDRTDYFYSGDPEVWNEAGVSTLASRNVLSKLIKTEQYRNGQKVAESKTTYRDWGRGVLLPDAVLSAKSEEEPEIRVKYNDIDPLNGNPLEVQMQGGVRICYIWGYNRTQPVAKIENSLPYQSINASLITAIQQASDAANYSETGLIAALNALRNDASMSGAMVTTYTYKQGVGVSSITDAKGDRTDYRYDSFGRLESVLDKNGNILSENKYRYQNQY